MNILVLYDQFSTHTNTVYDHLKAFSKFSKNTYAYCHGEGWTPKIKWKLFDALIIHYSLRVAYEVISSSLVTQIKSFQGIKILFVQDEYDFTERTRNAIEVLGIDIVYTCVPNQHIDSVYPRTRFPNVSFVQTYTGFVSDEIVKSSYKPISQRTIAIGYRGRALPYCYGDLGQEKQLIAERMKSYCACNSISCDIEWDDKYRIYGDKWLDFIGQCKTTLGTESGANIFDDYGDIRRRFVDYKKLNPNAKYADARLAVLGDFVEKPIMNQISPRIFESIICGTVLVLFEGNYSNIIKPGLHYISLKKDFSNIDDVFIQLNDDNRLQKIADQAYTDVVESKLYTFSSFIKNFDLLLDQKLSNKKTHNSNNLVFTWEVKPEVIRRASPVYSNWLLYLWRCMPLNFRIKIKPAARRAWNFFEHITKWR